LAYPDTVTLSLTAVHLHRLKKNVSAQKQLYDILSQFSFHTLCGRLHCFIWNVAETNPPPDPVFMEQALGVETNPIPDIIVVGYVILLLPSSVVHAMPRRMALTHIRCQLLFVSALLSITLEVFV
jgi:hypothetical protein